MIKTLSARFATWRMTRQTVRELSMLSDRELADLGIGRADIYAVANGSMLSEVADVSAARSSNVEALIGPDWAAHAPTSLAA